MFREPGLLRPSVVPPASITPFHAPLGVLESESLPMELLGRLRDDLNDCDTDVYVGRLASMTEWRTLGKDHPWQEVVESSSDGFALFLAGDWA